MVRDDTFASSRGSGPWLDFLFWRSVLRSCSWGVGDPLHFGDPVRVYRVSSTWELAVTSRAERIAQRATGVAAAVRRHVCRCLAGSNLDGFRVPPLADHRTFGVTFEALGVLSTTLVHLLNYYFLSSSPRRRPALYFCD